MPNETVCCLSYINFPREQLIMTWGGLRGAVGFSLAMVLKDDLVYRQAYCLVCAMMFLAIFDYIFLRIKCFQI